MAENLQREFKNNEKEKINFSLESIQNLWYSKNSINPRNTKIRLKSYLSSIFKIVKWSTEFVDLILTTSKIDKTEFLYLSPNQEELINWDEIKANLQSI